MASIPVQTPPITTNFAPAPGSVFDGIRVPVRDATALPPVPDDGRRASAAAAARVGEELTGNTHRGSGIGLSR